MMLKLCIYDASILKNMHHSFHKKSSTVFNTDGNKKMDFWRRIGFYTVQTLCAIALHLPYT